jgi:hypothetical protein
MVCPSVEGIIFCTVIAMQLNITAVLITASPSIFPMIALNKCAVTIEINCMMILNRNDGSYLPQ